MSSRANGPSRFLFPFFTSNLFPVSQANAVDYDSKVMITNDKLRGQSRNVLVGITGQMSSDLARGEQG